MQLLGVQELQALEEAAWASPERRALYSTRHIPGFPWYTVQESYGAFSSSTALPPLVRRHVVPYDYPFTVFVKGRWVGRRLLDVYAEELPHHTPAYYEACLRTGRLYCLQRGVLGQHNTQRKLLKRSLAPVLNSAEALNPKVLVNVPPPSTMIAAEHRETSSTYKRESVATSSVTPSSLLDDTAAAEANLVLHHGDVVYHTVHRHEVPVTVGVTGIDPVQITAVCIKRYGLICVTKPTGLPTHATGRYMYNSLTALLEYVLAPKRLHAWLITEDLLLQSLVSTADLSPSEKEELYAYYNKNATDDVGSEEFSNKNADGAQGEVSEVHPAKLPRPCHRLDKVTSGVLLLAVQQDAAKRIGTMLMRKAREVDEAVAAELSGAAENADSDTGKPTACNDESSDFTVSAPSTSLVPPHLQRILGRTYELQKYYLARVTGSLVKDTAEETSTCSGTAGRTIWWLSGSEDCLKRHNGAAGSLLKSASGICRTGNLEGLLADDDSQSFGVFPGGVFATKPIHEHSHGSISTSIKMDSEENTAKAAASTGHTRCDDEKTTVSETHNHSRVRVASLTAATLCQTLSQALRAQPSTDSRKGNPVPSCSAGCTSRPRTESVVLCTPYTGRLHQIRNHLASLGCPIVGDVVYASATGSTEVSQEASPQLAPNTEKATLSEDTHDSWTRNERDYIYFNAAQLPVAYRQYFSADQHAATSLKGPVHEAIIGVKRDRADACKQASKSLPFMPTLSSSAWQVEPRCYECVGRLPIVATKECATGTSAICLHAWSYEIKESLLLLQDPPTIESAIADACEEISTNGTMRVAKNVEVSRQVGGVRKIGGGFVRFEAPPPAWAFAARDDKFHIDG